YTLPLSGLNCMGCARKVEKALQQAHSVNITVLSPTEMTLESETPLRDLVATIETLGYQAGHQYHFALQGLSCGGCVKKLTTLLNAQPNVVRFDASKNELTLTTSLSEAEVVSLIATLGYQAQPFANRGLEI
ncbi:heavy-metal-associated domain-containing protein, partial [Vibrio parahaemolyticus]